MKFRVKELAREREWSLEEVAQRSGIKYSTVKNIWQNRSSDPNYSTLRAIAKAFSVPVEALEVPSEESNMGNSLPFTFQAYAA